ncbi:MAG TPA: hypothetical protein VHM70_20750 [Polyangiaceae bacterium]|nr:hypothetical protein [Polyangiaceae bacterium]
MNSSGSLFLIVSFLVMALALLVTLVVAISLASSLATRRRDTAASALAAGTWFALWSVVGASRVLDVWDSRPPRVLFMLVPTLIACVLLARSSIGLKVANRFDAASLVGFQAFRLPLELMMYRAACEGLMPMQMSFRGYNYEVVTGTVALLLWLVARRWALPRWVLIAFNALGLATLTTVVGIAIAAMPMFAAFGPNSLNVWVTHFPYLLLPTVMVPLALGGHLLLLRKSYRQSGPSALVGLERA